MKISEKAARLPSWARKILVVASIVAPISGASVTGFKACYEIRAATKIAAEAKVHAHEAQSDADDGYDTIGPAVAEIQKVLNLAMEWSSQTDADLDGYADRLDRCEIFMEKLSRRRGFPKMPNLEEDDSPRSWYEDPIASMMPGLPSGETRKVLKTMRPIPQSLNKAADYQQQRVKEHCAADDPLCGLGGLE